MKVELPSLRVGNSLMSPWGSQDSVPSMTPEERDSVLARLGHGGMSFLQWTGETLDKPGAAVRGLLDGNPGALLNLIPFSDTLGITDPKSRVSGRDLLEHWGVLGPNTEGMDTGDWLGFAAELATDPMTYIGLGGLSRLGQTASKASPAFGRTIAARSAEIASGQRGLVSASLPRPLGLLGLDTQATYIPKWATGPGAAKAYEKLAYSAPARVTRALFNANPYGARAAGFLDSVSREFQEAADAGANKLWTELGRNMEDVSSAVTGLRNLEPQFNALMQQGQKLHEATALFPGQKNFGNLNFDDFLRNVGEMKDFQQALQQAQQLGMSGDAVQFLEASRKLTERLYGDAATNTYGLLDGLKENLRNMGLDTGDLEDELIDFIHRRASIRMPGTGLGMAGGKINHARGDVWRDLPTSIINQLSRDDALVGHAHSLDQAIARGELGADTAAAKSRVAQILTARATAQTFKPQDAAAYIVKNYGTKQMWANYALKRNPKGNPAKAIADLAEALQGLPVGLLKDNQGLFGNAVIQDSLNYLERAIRKQGAMTAVHNLLGRVADSSPNAIGRTVREAFEELPGIGTRKGPGGDAAVDRALEYLSKMTGKNKADLSMMRVPDNFMETASKFMTTFSDPVKEMGWVKAWDKYLSAIKGNLTLPFPAFHLRNLISGMWQNIVTAFENPVQGVRAFRAAIHAAREGIENQDIQNMILHGLLTPAEGKSVGELLSKSSKANARAAGVPDFTVEGLNGALQPAVDAATDAAFLVRHPVQAAKKIIKGESSGTLNPLKVRGVQEATSGGSKFAPARIGEAMHNTVEFLNRASHYLARIEQGWAPSMAAWSAKMAHFDYQAIAHGSPFQAQLLRRIIPFYAFSRFNFPMQIGELFANPGGRTAQTIRALDNMRPESPRGLMPQYLSESGSVFDTNPGSDERNKNYITISSLLPIQEALSKVALSNPESVLPKWMPGIFSGSIPDPQRTLQIALGQTAGPLQFPVQVATGKQLWSGRDLEDLYQYPFSGTTSNTAFNSLTPFGRYATTLRQLGDDRKTATMKAINALIGGVRATTVDVPKQLSIEGQDLLRKMFRGNRNFGEFSKAFVDKEDLPNLSPEELQQYQLYLALMQWSKELKQKQAK